MKSGASLTAAQETELQRMEAKMGIGTERMGGGAAVETANNTAICAAFKRVERLQFKFMLIYQILIVVLAVIVVALLAFTALRLVGNAPIEALVAGTGAIVGGVAAAFLNKQRGDARNVHRAALAGLVKHGCG